MNQQTLKYQLLADLLATLEAEEFPIGVGKHLELQQLYSRLPEDLEPEEMKTLLAPIFAKNKQDQAFFYEVFDQSLSRVNAKTWQPTDQPISPILPKKSKWEIITKILGLFLLLLAAWLAYLRFFDPELVTPAPCNQYLSVEPDSMYVLNLLDSLAESDELRREMILDESPDFVSFLNGETVGEIPEIGNYQIDSNGVFTIKTKEDFEASEEVFTVTAIAKYKLGTDTTNFILRQKKETKPEVKEPTPPEREELSLKPHPFPKILPFPNQPPLWVSYFDQYKYWIKPILIFLLYALFGAYLNWWSERQQRIIADIQSKNDPPLLWNIKIPNISKINLNEDYFKVLQLMRQRTSVDHYVLNIPKTIDKTIEKGGIIDFQYQHKTRPPEYLLLIDRQSSKNHRAYLYDYLFESFKDNEVFIERFFFEGDIRLCWNEYYPNGIKLQDLQQTFRDARLIIVGSGYQLLNPVTGKLAKWTRVFDNWADKAILSPRPTKNWGAREKQLLQKFILLPASVESLTAMVDKMEAIDPDEIKTKINDEVNEPIEFRGGLIETLQHYFSIKKSGEPNDESLIHWIAACAIYPTLHWDLTMYLGQELSTEDNNLLTFDHIHQLTRLPWFVEGKIPEQARLELLEYLPEEIEIQVRKSLRDLFDTIPPPDENSVAYADSRINISLNKYLLEKNNLLKTEIEQYAKAGADIDVTMLKYLEGEKSPKDFEVDSNLRKYAEGEKPKVGLDRWTKFLSFIVIALTIGIIAYSPSFEKCMGELVEYKDLELCLTTSDDHLIYRAAQIRDEINKNNYQAIDSLELLALEDYFVKNRSVSIENIPIDSKSEYGVESIIPLVKEDSSILHFYQNLAVDFYNHGVPSYNRFDSLGKSVTEYYETSGDSVIFCTAFSKAKSYDDKIASSGISAIVKDILKLACLNFGEVTGEENPLISAPPLSSSTRKIGGKVYDSENLNLRLAGVEVAFLDQKTLTNQQGRYEFDLPKELSQRSYEIKYSKANFKDTSKEFLREDLLITLLPSDLPNVFLEKKTTTNANSCYNAKMAEYKKIYESRDYEVARKILEEAKRCDGITQVQSLEVETKIKQVDFRLRLLKENKSPIQSGKEEKPFPIENKEYIEVEIRNIITKNLQTGYDLEIEGVDPTQITTLRSGAQYKVEVPEKQKDYTISVVLQGVTKAQKTITVIPGSVKNITKVEFEVGLPILQLSDLPEFKMIYIKAGKFEMGSDQGKVKLEQQPKHTVDVSPFYIQKYEVTQRLWKLVMGDNPSKNICPKCPVNNVTWEDAQNFVRKLNSKTGENYRLPYEAEWEYAARGGQNFIYAGSQNLKNVGWYSGNTKDKTHPFGELRPNGYELFDMTGNVMEWVEDGAYRNYDGAPKNTYSPWRNPKGNDRVARGGSIYHRGNDCEVTSRFFYQRNYKSYWLGFRVAKSVTF